MKEGGKCLARRIHPLSTDFYVVCEREAGHEGKHANDGVEWDDASEYALPGLERPE